MALSSTIYNFDIELSDVDRNVYETLSLRVARHPSETEEYLVTRVLAYCLEYAEGIAFSKGLSQADEPAVVVRDLTGALQAWIEVGAPDADRLHKASKAAPRVAVYILKEPRIYLGQLAGARIHRADSIDIFAIERSLLDALVARLDRRTKLTLAITDRHIYATIGSETIDGGVEKIVLAG
ncbi:MAG: YaeQ family protein [Gemmatimonadaceae bacterium]